MKREMAVFDYLNSKGAVLLDDCEDQVLFVSRSQTHENYKIIAREIYGEAHYLLRINTGSRLGLCDQCDYEFAVLHALRRSGVTPRPFFSECEPKQGLGKGVLLTEFLPGRFFTYSGDWKRAATTLAVVHAQPTDSRLLAQKNPVASIVHECEGLAERFEEDGHRRARAAYAECLDSLRRLSRAAEATYTDHEMVIVHGELCASDFVVDDESGVCGLVDWECGMLSNRFVDLGQFMAKATLAGEYGYCRNESECRSFLSAYKDAARLEFSIETLLECSEIMIEATRLRSMIWNCVALTGKIEGIGACGRF